jgi:putative nucleotidyltransferase with HDIG domain
MRASAPPARLVEAIDRLAPLPVTARRLLDALNGEDVALQEVSRLLEFDQAVAAAILRLARSAAYAGYRAPETVRDAVMRLGTVKLLNLLLSTYLQQLRQDAPLYQLGEDDLWRHGAAAELAVRALMQERPHAGIPPLAQTAALLHDIGKLVMCQVFHVDVRAIVEHAQRRGTTFVEAECDLLGTDHANIGGAVAEQWSFPDVVVDAIRQHHCPEPAGRSTVLDAVVVANLVAKTIEVGLGAEGLNFALDVSALRRLGLDFASFGRVCLQTESWLRDVTRSSATEGSEPKARAVR